MNKICKNCAHFSETSDFPNYHMCLFYGFYFDAKLASTQTLCEKKFTPRVTQVTKRKEETK